MAITDTQQTAQFAASAAVSAAEAKQYMLEAEQGYQDTSAATQQAQDAASAAELARDQAESIASGLEEKIDAQLTEQQEEFETQMTK